MSVSMTEKIKRLGVSRQRLRNLEATAGEIHRQLLIPRCAGRYRRWWSSSSTGHPPAGFADALTGLLEVAEHGGRLGLSELEAFSRWWQPGAPGWRREPIAPLTRHHQPFSPETIPRSLERLFEWAESGGFNEMPAPAQISLLQMRLLEIAPFGGAQFAGVVLFSSLTAVSCGHLLPVPRMDDSLETALDQAFQFQTEALVEWNLDNCLSAYDLVFSLVQLE